MDTTRHSIPARTRRVAIAASTLALALSACTGGAPIVDREDRADRAREAARSVQATATVRVPEAFATPMTPQDNIDSVASWTAPGGQVLVFATAKSTHRLVVYDGSSGGFVRHVGERGAGPGQFDRPNGIAVAGDLLFVVERDNRRVQVLALPDLQPVAQFGSDELQLPYGLWVREDGSRYVVYVTDAYMAGEDAQGEDILPPLSELDRRVHRYAFDPGDGVARHLGAFGDTSPEGALRVVESLWGDPLHDRLLVAEEDETYANEFKVYDLDGRFTGRLVGTGILQAQAEGVMLKTCADGRGWWITTEQGKGRTSFHLFDRLSLQHAGAVAGETVANTDGIWLHDAPAPGFPDGVLYAVHDDQGVVAIDWNDIARALELPACAR